MRTDAPTRPPATPSTDDPFAPAAPRRVTWFVVLALLVGLVVGAGATALWYSAELDDRDAAATAAAAELNAHIDTLDAQLTELRSAGGTLAEDLAAAEARLDQMIGPGLPDGRRFGFIEAVGATQEPPRLVFDLAQWFTDEEADAAAIEDGQMPPGMGHVENGYYIRNGSPRWRMVEVDPATMVALVVYPYGDIDHPELVTFERFGELVQEEPGLIGWSPYWLDVEDGIVTGIEQRFIP